MFQSVYEVCVLSRPVRFVHYSSPADHVQGTSDGIREENMIMNHDLYGVGTIDQFAPCLIRRLGYGNL